ncbi:hypothetical protein [Spirosoma aerophilum]
MKIYEMRGGGCSGTFGSVSGKTWLRRQQKVTWLIGLGILLNLAGCRPDQEDSLTPRTTDQLARLEEWVVAGPASQTGTAMLTDTLNWLKVDQTYYYIQHAIKSSYRYDGQNRLSQQTTGGYRNDSDYGRTQSIRTHQYQYNANQLTIRTTLDWINSWNGSASFSGQQHLALNQERLVDRQPQLGDVYSPGDNGYSGISRLFSTCLNPFIRDTLRRYDAQGYLMEAANGLPSLGADFWQLSQSINVGNVVSHQLLTKPTSLFTPDAESTRWVEEYDRNRPTIPNPHQFLGSTSRNLVVRTLQYYSNQSKPSVFVYRYEYDAKGRVERYFISLDQQGVSTLQTVGKLTYLLD